jgi:hypothetical protein
MSNSLPGIIVSYVQWGQAEAPVSVLSVCLPRIFHLFKHYFYRSSLGQRHTTQGSGSRSTKAPYPSGSDYSSHSGLRSKQGEEYLRLQDFNGVQGTSPYSAQATAMAAKPNPDSSWEDYDPKVLRGLNDIHLKRDVQISRDSRV